MRFSYKYYPNARGGSEWWAALAVQISNPAKHSPPTKRFEAMIDSGASRCIFHANLGRAIGLNIENGEAEDTTGISGEPTTTYLHNISLHVPGGHSLRVRAGFTDQLPVAGLLGRQGFFEHFKITFDPSSNPPGFELQRIYCA